MNRITFIKQAGLLGGGALVASNALAGNLFTRQHKGAMGVGIIGCGDRGKGIMSLIQSSFQGKFNIRAYCDNMEFRLKEAERFADSSAAKYLDYRRLLDDKAVEVVFIAVPLYEHFRLAKDALLAGKHVYLEKTMTFSIAEALELVKIVEKYPKQTFQVGYQYRSSPLYMLVKEMIKADRLGKVSQIDCRWDRNNNWKRMVPDSSLERRVNWRLYREYSGGLTAELLSHQMDFIHWAFDIHPDQISGVGGVDIYKDGRETYDNIQLNLRYEKEGLIGNFGTTLGNARDSYLFKIKGTKGTISLLFNSGVLYPEDSAEESVLEIVDGVTGATKIVRNDDGGIPLLPGDTKDGTFYALEQFHQCIQTATLPLSNVYTGAKGAICAALGNEALYTGAIQRWIPQYNVG